MEEVIMETWPQVDTQAGLWQLEVPLTFPCP